MMQTDLSKLRSRVEEVAQRSALADRLDGVTLEADRDNEGSDFLRVIIELKQLDAVRDEDLVGLMDAVEEAVSALDDRFPSVRFAEAA